MADETERAVSLSLSVVIEGTDADITLVAEVLSRAQLGLALEGYTASVTMTTFDPNTEDGL